MRRCSSRLGWVFVALPASVSMTHRAAAGEAPAERRGDQVIADFEEFEPEP